MTRYLALDTATARASLAVGEPRGGALERVVAERRDLSRGIERVTAELLQAAGARAQDLAGVLVADGPGSFTGLRIGAAFAKGVCRALGVPLLVAPSLLGSARSALDGAGTVLVRYDALRGELYQAVYAFAPDGAAHVVQPPMLVLVGEGAAAPGAVLATERHASAASLLRLIGVPGGAEPVGEASGWEPAYGRPAEAEVRLRQRLARGGGD